MSGILFDVLEINIVVSVAVLILYFSSGRLRGRYGAAWMKMIWLILAVRLFIPYNISLPGAWIQLFNTPGFAKTQVSSDPAEDADSEVGNEDLSVDSYDGQGWNGYNEMAGNVNGGLKGDAAADVNDGMDGITAGGHGSASDAAKGNMTAGAGDRMPDGMESGVNNVMEADRSGSAADNAKDTVGNITGSITNVMLCVWLMGSAAAFLYTAACYFLVYRKCKSGIRRICDKDFYRKIMSIQKKLSDRAGIPVYDSEYIASPMLIGVFHPKLVLPVRRETWDDTELELMMAHELCHYRNKDLFLKFAMMTVCCIHWFNPAVYLMKRQFFYEMELACDETVLRKREGKEKDIYARMILSFAGSGREMSAFSTGMWENKKRMKKRLSYLLEEGGRKKGILGLVIAVTVLLSAGLFVSCGYKPDEKSDAGTGESQAEISVSGEADGNSFVQIPETEAGNNENESNSGQEETFDYNHAYNEMLRHYGNGIFLAREDGIYYLEDGGEEEKLIFENAYELRRGMELYHNFLYFCGSARRGEETAATIYRMNLDTLEAEDALAASEQIFKALYAISIYEGKLYVCTGMESRIGFELDENGNIGGQLDAVAGDFLYQEYNEYVELELTKLNTEYGSEEYRTLSEEASSKYEACMDVASCKKLLDGKQVVGRYKDELLISLYLEDENGVYEYLCDSMRYPTMITKDGIYYIPDEEGNVWYLDFETRTPGVFYGGQAQELESVSLLNYDNQYVYLLKSRHVGYDGEDMPVMEDFILRVPIQGGEPEKVFRLDLKNRLNQPYAIYRHCAVYDNRMYFEEYDTISLNPEDNGMAEDNVQLVSEDTAEMTRIVEAFTEAYFDNDENTLITFLSEDFDGPVTLYPYPEEALRIEKGHIWGLPEGNLAVGTKCPFLTCEFNAGAETDDAPGYMNLTIVKTEQGFRVQEYEVYLP